jgi:hypothetical protein
MVLGAKHVESPFIELGQLATSTLSGSLLLSHSIEPKTLPTWTKAKYVSNDDPSPVSDQLSMHGGAHIRPQRDEFIQFHSHFKRTINWSCRPAMKHRSAS